MIEDSMRIWDDITPPDLDPKDRQIDRLAYQVGRDHGVSIGKIKSGCRNRYLVDARQDLARKLHFTLGLSYSGIGRYMRRHYTTIIYYIEDRPYK